MSNMEDISEENDFNLYYEDNDINKEKNNKNAKSILQKQSFQKFNIEKLEDKKINKNFRFCQKCNSLINSFFLNGKLIKLLFNQQKKDLISKNDNSLFINELPPNLCQNCLKLSLDEFYFKNNKNSKEINKMDTGILEIFQVFEHMDEEKLNINLRLYSIYKKLINSFVDYIKDDLNSYKNVFDENAQNIKNQKIMGIDCLLNIIDLLNKNISLIKEKNAIKKVFLEEINKEKNLLIKEHTNINEGFDMKNKNKNIFKNENIFNLCDNKENKSNKLEEKKDFNIKLKINQNLFKTKIVRKKKKDKIGKRFKRSFKKIKFNIEIK